MCKNLLPIILLVIFSLGCSKSKNGFTVKELMSMSNMNIDDFESYVMSKDYKLKTSYAGELYFFDKKDEGQEKETYDDVVSWEQEKGRRIVTYQIHDENKYSKIKDEVKNSGFAFTGSGNPIDGSGTSLYYMNSGTALTLITIPKREGLISNLYRVEIKQPMP